MVPDRIVRAPLPDPIPRGVRCRLRYFEALWAQFAADATATLAELKTSGWSEEAAREALTGYAAWISGNVDGAVALALFMDELEGA